MGQISMHEAARPNNSQSILSDVVIRPDLEQQWFDALGRFACRMRLELGMKHIVCIDNEKGFINSAGELIVSVDVNDEGVLQMAFPAGTWGWKDGDSSRTLPAPDYWGLLPVFRTDS